MSINQQWNSRAEAIKALRETLKLSISINYNFDGVVEFIIYDDDKEFIGLNENHDELAAINESYAKWEHRNDVY